MKNDKIKTMIINYWANRINYGADLTAYALQYLINNLGDYSCFLIDNQFLCLKFLYNKLNFFKDFEKNIKKSEYLYKYSDFNNLNNYTKIFITGSDQVFRVSGLGNHRYQYLLDYVNSNKKKIAFSASFGVNKEQFIKETSQKTIENMKFSLSSFDFISVREKSGVKICKDLFDIDTEWIIDPVFIMDNSKYDELIKNSTKDFSNKIVSYVLDTNKEYKKAHKYLSKKYNLEVIELANSNESIENWLAAIKNCKFLITDSFHGMCFAIIFNKPFICLSNKDRGATRFESILEMLGIDNQCIDNPLEILEKDCIFKVDYDRVNQRIEEERQRGLYFLKKALEAPVGKREEKIEAKMQFLENKVIELEQQATLKYQIKKELWNLWLIIFHRYLPNPIKKIIRALKNKFRGGKKYILIYLLFLALVVTA